MGYIRTMLFIQYFFFSPPNKQVKQAIFPTEFLRENTLTLRSIEIPQKILGFFSLHILLHSLKAFIIQSEIRIKP